MKIRKALDRAQKERTNRPELPIDDEVNMSTPDYFRKALDRAQKERTDKPELPLNNEVNLTTPVYSKSRQTHLDLKVLKKNLCVSYFVDSAVSDLYKAVRTQIVQKMRNNGWRTLLISSALPGEGKSVTTINLAITFAKELHQTVLLVDADLRKQSIHKYLGYESSTGLTDYLVNSVPLPDLIVWPGVESLSIISGGQTVSDSTELLSSQRMRMLVDEMKNRYKERFIIFDSAPILGCPDAIAFAPLVDAVAMVVEANRTSIEDLKRAKNLIPAEKFLGFILNKDKVRGSKKNAYQYY